MYYCSELASLPYPEGCDKEGNSILHYLATAGEIKVVGEVLAQEKVQSDQVNKDDNTFLHIYAQHHELKPLFEEFEENNYFYEFFKEKKGYAMKNQNGHTFLAIALNSAKTEAQKDIIDAMDNIADEFGDDVIFNLCKETDIKGNTLLHLAVHNSLQDLVVYLLPKTKDPKKSFNQDGYNPFHLAVYNDDTSMVRCIMDTIGHTLDVNDAMPNDERALHLAAKQDNLNMIEELIERGGDLTLQDEDGHTPLHDCLQQVYVEGGFENEKSCEKFLDVWNKIVEEAVTWWCLKHSEFKPLKGSTPYIYLQQKAVYYLRSCVENKNGFSVLQYAADIGLVPCVRAMLVTKGVFAIPYEDKETEREQIGDDYEGKFDVDVTNLSPEYYIKRETLYTEEELNKLKSATNNENNKQQV